jgi:hypothetical protein
MVCAHAFPSAFLTFAINAVIRVVGVPFPPVARQTTPQHPGISAIKSTQKPPPAHRRQREQEQRCSDNGRSAPGLAYFGAGHGWA